MEEKNKKRPTKKQFELLDFIAKFVAEKGYGPSYREIMAGCNYSSVATVAVHINNLVANGNLSKKDRSARSLEVVKSPEDSSSQKKVDIKPSDEKWLVDLVEKHFFLAEASDHDIKQVDNLYVLVGALKVLGFDGAANSYASRLKTLKNGL